MIPYVSVVIVHRINFIRFLLIRKKKGRNVIILSRGIAVSVTIPTPSHDDNPHVHVCLYTIHVHDIIREHNIVFVYKTNAK